MAQKRRRAKRLRRVRVGDPAFLKACAALDGGMHGFNAAGHRRREAEDLYRLPVRCLRRNHAANGARPCRRPGCGQELDGVVPKSLEFLIQSSESPTVLDLAEFRERMMRRAEHWKSLAHAAVAERTEPEQRGLRRQQLLDPLLEKAGIPSDDAWAERAETTQTGTRRETTGPAKPRNSVRRLGRFSPKRWEYHPPNCPSNSPGGHCARLSHTM